MNILEFEKDNRCILNGPLAFKDCESLESITINCLSKEIPEESFSGCTNLMSITISNNQYFQLKEGVLYSKNNQILYLYPAMKPETSYTIAVGTTTIIKYAFYGCKRLISISIPDTVSDIGSNAFSSCKKIMNIWANMQNPQDIDDNVFEDFVYANATLHIPTGTIDKYKTTAAWSKFNTINEFEPSGIASPTIALQRVYSDNGVIYIESAADGNCNIYSMSGQLIRTLALKKGTNTVSGLTKGVYIVNGQKVMVR